MKIGRLTIAWAPRSATQGTSEPVAPSLAEERYRAMLEYAPVMINSFASDGRCLMWNQACVDTLGYTMDDVNASADPMALFYPDPKEKERVIQGIRNRDGKFQEYRVRIRDGSELVQMWANFALGATGVISFGYDITALRRAEEELQRLNGLLGERVARQDESLKVSEDRLYIAMKSGKMGTWEFDIPSASGVFSPPMKEILGIPDRPDRYQLEDFFDLIHPEDRSRVRSAWEKALREGSEYRVEYRAIRPCDCEETWLLSAAIPSKKMPFVVFGISADISERKRSERLIEEQRLKMVTSSKLSALGEMAGGIAHEINNPLTIIHGNAGLLKTYIRAGSLDTNQIAKIAEKIESTAVRISRIVKSLRSLSRDAEKEPFRSESLRSIFEDTLELCQERFRNHGIALTTDSVPETLMIDCRAGQISQVLLNLLNNAFDAIAGIKSERWVRLGLVDQGEEIEISVTDSGKGIPDELREKILQPFFTTKEVGKGTGLGLSISKALIGEHGGKFQLDNECPNTRFVFNIPKRQR